MSFEYDEFGNLRFKKKLDLSDLNWKPDLGLNVFEEKEVGGDSGHDIVSNLWEKKTVLDKDFDFKTFEPQFRKKKFDLDGLGGYGGGGGFDGGACNCA